MRPLLLATILALAAAALTACSSAPVTGRQQLMLMSDSEANAMGRDAYREILAEKGVASNPEQTAMVRRVGERIAAAVGMGLSHRSYGVIMEYSHSGTGENAESIVRNMVEEAMALRDLPVADIKVAVKEHVVQRIGCAVAAVVFWPDDAAGGRRRDR